MPHLIIEYPADKAGGEQIEALLDAVHLAVAASGLFEPSHIKLRAIPLQHYRRGGLRQPFFHVQLRIHTGRSSDQKQALSRAVLAVLRAQAWIEGVITVEVVEMERECYAKYAP